MFIKFGSQKKIAVLLFTSIILLATFFHTNVKNGKSVDYVTETYIEDFEQLTYYDLYNTNAAGWGTGEIGIAKDIQLVADFYTDGVAYNLAVEGNLLYLADGSSGLRIINVSSPSTPDPLYTHVNGIVRDVALIDNLAVYGGDSIPVTILNVTNPNSPIELGSITLGPETRDIQIRNNLTYVADYHSGLFIVNITDPENPVQIGHCSTPDYTWRVTLHGSIAYLSDMWGGIQIVDISDTTNPVIVNNYSTLSVAHAFTIANNYGFIASYSSGLEIVDISNPTNLVFVSSCQTYDYCVDIIVNQNEAYIACHNGGFLVIDVGNITSPEIISHYNTDGAVIDIVFENDLVYAADHSDHLKIFNVTTMSEAAAQSLDVSVSSLPIVYANLTAEMSTPIDTSIEFYLSYDGTSWYLAEPGYPISYSDNLSTLYWRAILQTTNNTVTPKLTEIRIDITYSMLEAGDLLPYWAWGLISGGVVVFLVAIIVIDRILKKKQI